MLLYNRELTERALNALGEILEARGQRFSIVVIGGTALNLLRIVDRATVDVDILAFADANDASPRPTLFEPPHPLPPPLSAAIEQVAADFKLGATWLNTGPALQWRQGLPPGLEHRLEWRQFGALAIGLASRYDLIFFKLYAAADSTGPGSKHVQDLLALQPSDTELQEAARWVREQDASPAFHEIVEKVIAYVRQTRQGHAP